MPSIVEFMQNQQNPPPIAPTQDEGLKHTPAGVPVAPYAHGNNGLFNIPGTNDQIFSAMLVPLGGALDVIPVINNDPAGEDSGNMFGGEMEALDTLLTGVTAGALDDFANQPTTDCADGPVGGLTKVCTIVNPFGRYRAGVREVSIVRAGEREDRCDPLTLRLMNMSEPMQSILGVPNMAASPANVLANEIARRMWESAISFRRMFAPRVWTGTPANNNGQARDIVGLETHINTGNKIDFQSSAICTAANSVVLDFGFDLVGGNGRDIAEYIETATYNAFEWNAGRMGLTPLEGIVFMHPILWREVSSIWPIRQFQHSLNQMVQFTNGRVTVDGMSAINQRNAFREAHILPINGRNYQVIEDDAMALTTPNENANLQPGQFSGDIFGIPMTVMGGIPVTFWQHFRHDNVNSRAIQQLAGGSMTFTSDGGVFRWYVNFQNGCLNMTFEFSPRLKVKTPMVAWRIDNIAVEPLLRPREFDPSGTYFVDGGVTESPDEQFYAPWSPTTPVTI